VLVAQGVAGAGVDLSLIYQYGGLLFLSVVALAAVRVLFNREAKALDLERERADRLEDELRKLNATIAEKMVPVLTQATATMERALKLLARRDDS
jgi:hypothetical protein